MKYRHTGTEWSLMVASIIHSIEWFKYTNIVFVYGYWWKFIEERYGRIRDFKEVVNQDLLFWSSGNLRTKT